MNSSDENHFQTNTRTFVLFRLNTLPRLAPFSQLPTRGGGANLVASQLARQNLELIYLSELLQFSTRTLCAHYVITTMEPDRGWLGKSDPRCPGRRQVTVGSTQYGSTEVLLPYFRLYSATLHTLPSKVLSYFRTKVLSQKVLSYFRVLSYCTTKVLSVLSKVLSKVHVRKYFRTKVVVPPKVVYSYTCRVATSQLLGPILLSCRI